MDVNPKLVALKLFLSSLGIDDDISTVDDRKRVQKAVYLGQVAGADLGYRFSWYLMGPYSTTLTDDYYCMDAKKTDVEQLAQGKGLHPSYAAVLEQIRPILQKPLAFPLADEKWLELLASYHYLRKVSQLDHDGAVQTLRLKKPDLADYAVEARAAIQGTLLAVAN